MSVVSRDLGEDLWEVVLSDARRRNALGYGTLAALRAAVDDAVVAGARVVVLAADGPAFSAGADFRDLTGALTNLEFDDALSSTARALRRAPVPIVAAVDGPCIGAAVDLALSCDFVVAGESSRFELPALRLGLLYNPAAIARWHRTVSGAALRSLLLGVPLDARSAAVHGLVAKVVADGQARCVAIDVARLMTAGLPEATKATKSLLAALDEGRSDLDEWSAWRRRLLASEERRAALDARRR